MSGSSMKPYRTATRYTPSASDRTSNRSASGTFGRRLGDDVDEDRPLRTDVEVMDEPPERRRHAVEIAREEDRAAARGQRPVLARARCDAPRRSSSARAVAPPECAVPSPSVVMTTTIATARTRGTTRRARPSTRSPRRTAGRPRGTRRRRRPRRRRRGPAYPAGRRRGTRS